MSSKHDPEIQNESAPQNEHEPVVQQSEAPSDETNAESTDEAGGDTPAIFGEMTLPTSEAAQWLRMVADAVEAGTLPGATDTVAIPEKLSYKLELEQELEESISSLEYEIEIEIEWNAES